MPDTTISYADPAPVTLAPAGAPPAISRDEQERLALARAGARAGDWMAYERALRAVAFAAAWRRLRDRLARLVG